MIGGCIADACADVHPRDRFGEDVMLSTVVPKGGHAELCLIGGFERGIPVGPFRPIDKVLADRYASEVFRKCTSNDGKAPPLVKMWHPFSSVNNARTSDRSKPKIHNKTPLPR